MYLSMFLRVWIQRGWDVTYIGFVQSKQPVLCMAKFRKLHGSKRGRINFIFSRRVRIGCYYVRLSPWVWLRYLLAGLYRVVARRWPSLKAIGLRHPPEAASLLITLKRLLPAERRLIASNLAELKPGDIAVANYSYLADGFDFAPPGVVRLIITHDILFQRMESLRQPGAHLMRVREEELLGKGTLLVAIHDKDAAVCRELAPASRVCTVPIGLTINDDLPARDPQGCRVLFVGSAAQHNISGLHWFLTEVWPKLVQLAPCARLTLCGRVGGSLSRLPAGVEDLGLVRDIAPIYADAAVVIVPLVEGSGLKIKLIEALAAGRPVVTSPIGLQGVEFLVEIGACRRANSATEFARAIAELLQSPDARRLMGAKARAAAREYFSEHAVMQTLFAILDA